LSLLLLSLLLRRPPCAPLFPYTTLFRSLLVAPFVAPVVVAVVLVVPVAIVHRSLLAGLGPAAFGAMFGSRIMAMAVRSPLVVARSEEHTSELQSRENLVCRLLLEKKKEK